MHILVINDDGPPSQKSSPYIHAFVSTLQNGGHTVSVVLPHQQRSWIGKAHFANQLVKPTYFRPGTLHQDDGTTSDQPFASRAEEEEWILLDSTPATCAQLGLFHFFQDRGPVDLVVSGPNYGRNSTALFSLSSGTIGGTMEAALCRKKALALSFAFFSRDHKPLLIADACQKSLKIIEHLYGIWPPDIDLYSINVPVMEGVKDNKVFYTYALQNYWSSGSSFEEIEPAEDDPDPENREMEIRQSGELDNEDLQTSKTLHTHKHFKWAPRYSDITKTIETSPAGNDGWAIKQGYSSVTPLKTNFMHVPTTQLGELKLFSSPGLDLINKIAKPSDPRFYALINYEDPYVQPLILQALATQFPPSSYALIPSVSSLPSPSSPLLQIAQYESIDFAHLLAHPTTHLANAYITRIALIRKHFLAHTVSAWCAKSPSSPLNYHIKPTLDFELDYAEFLDDALIEAYELHESFARNAALPPPEQEWWILKPGMSDRGQGIRLFSTEAQLLAIFEEWETDLSDTDGDSGSVLDSASHNQETTSPAETPRSNYILTSLLRHFVVQPYIDPPLLLTTFQNRKFHLRSYVLALGALRVYIYRDLLALFAPLPYTPPWISSSDLSIHLTNTCLLSSSPSSLSSPSQSPTVALFSHLPSAAAPHLSPDWKRVAEMQIARVTGELFLAAARTQSTHFQALPNSFEVFGVDWMLDAGGRAWLLEVNAFPDFARSGEVGRGVVSGVWNGVVGLVGMERGGFLRGGGDDDEGEGERWGMKKVLDVDLGRR